MLVPSLNLASAARALGLTMAHPGVFVAIGLHPTEVESLTDADLDQLRRLADHPRTVAIGEIGLDYFWVRDSAPRAHQRSALRSQLKLASQLHMPVVLHLREEGDAETGDCAADMITILEEWVSGLRLENRVLARRPGVLHSFSGTPETAMRAIGLGFDIGITGPITYRNADSRRQMAAGLPLDKILIETDAPFLTPHPNRGKRNEPAFVTLIADRIAQLQSCTLGEVANVTTANAQRLFGWG
jgi:TatD DNase family protein